MEERRNFAFVAMLVMRRLLPTGNQWAGVPCPCSPGMCQVTFSLMFLIPSLLRRA